MNDFCQHSTFTESGRPLTSLVIRPSKDIPFDEKNDTNVDLDTQTHTLQYDNRKKRIFKCRIFAVLAEDMPVETNVQWLLAADSIIALTSMLT